MQWEYWRNQKGPPRQLYVQISALLFAPTYGHMQGYGHPDILFDCPIMGEKMGHNKKDKTLFWWNITVHHKAPNSKHSQPQPQPQFIQNAWIRLDSFSTLMGLHVLQILCVLDIYSNISC